MFLVTAPPKKFVVFFSTTASWWFHNKIREEDMLPELQLDEDALTMGDFLRECYSDREVRKIRKRMNRYESVIESTKEELKQGGSAIFKASNLPSTIRGTSRNEDERPILFRVCTHRYFDASIIAVILASSILTAAGKSIPELDLAFTCVFVAEIVLKLAAFSPRGYFSNAWNRFDFVVVAATLVFSNSGVNLTGVRGLRVLKALRAVSKSENMRSIASALFESLKTMRSIGALYMFFIFVISIFGVQFYSGSLRYRCVPLESGNGTEYDGDLLAFCIPREPAAAACDGRCLPGFSNPESGFISFDSVPQAAVTMFAAMTLEGWIETLEYLAAASSAGRLNALYFILAIVFGSYVCVNLMIATLFESHKIAKDRIEEERRIASVQARIQSWGHVDERGRAWSSRVKSAVKRWKSEAKKRGVYSHGLGNILLDLGYPPFYKEGGREAPMPTAALDVHVHLQTLNVKGTEFRLDETRLVEILVEQGSRTLDLLVGGQEDPPPPLPLQDLARGRVDDGGCLDVEMRRSVSSLQSRSGKEEEDKARETWVQIAGTWLINLCIAANAVSLALEKFDQDKQEFDPVRLRIIEWTNLVTVVVFSLESVILIARMGPGKYFCNSWCQMDFSICVVSVVDLLLTSIDIPGVTIVRTIRWVRAFRLARSWRALNRLLQTIINSFLAVRAFTFFLAFFWLFCALLGYQTISSGEEPRYNYATFANAVVSVFVVMTGENWDEIMWENAASASGGEANSLSGWLVVLAHFMIFIVGNMIVLNLFLAILLENFDGISGKDSSADEDESVRPSSSSSQPPSSKSQPDNPPPITSTDVTLDVDTPNLGVVSGSESGPGSLARFLRTALERRSGEEEEEEEESALLLSISHLVIRLASMETFKLRVGNAVYYSAFLREDLDAWLVRTGEAPEPGDTDNIRNCLVSYKIVIPVVRPSAAEKLALLDGSDLVEVRKMLAAEPRVPLRFGNLDPTQVGSEVGVAGALLDAASTTRRSRSEVYSKNFEAEMCRMREQGRSLGVLGPENPFRLACAKVVANQYFDYAILACIVTSSILLAVETPSDPGEGVETDASRFFRIADTFMLVVFGIEAGLKIVVSGLVSGRHAYLRDAWNALDFGVLLLGLVESTASVSPELRALRAVRTVRALRPLRALRRNEGLKTLVESLIYSVPSIINILSIFALVFFVFAVVGIDLFAGRLSRCSVDETLDISACRMAGGEWKNGQWSFDDFGSALLVVMELSLQEMFPSAGLVMADSTAPGLPPERDAFAWAHVYTFSLIIMCNMFMTNLMTGAVIDNFFRIQNGKMGAASLSQSQLEWAQTQRFLLKVRPMRALRRPQAAASAKRCACLSRFVFRVRTLFFDVVSNQAFENLILAVIMLNIAAIAMQFEGQSPEYGQVLEMYLGNTFSAIYLVEMMIKMVGLGVGQYFSSWWNRADFVMVASSGMGFLTSSPALSGLAPVLRVFRIVRITKLIPRFKNLRRVISTFVATLPSIMNIGLLIMLVYFVFAILGMNFFWAADLGGEYLNEFTNFRNIGNALLAVFQSSTGENWNGIMFELSSQGYAIQARMFFFGLAIVGNLILINLFVAVVISNFHDESEASGLGVDDLEKFADTWSELATEDSPLFMKSYRLPDLIRQVPPPLGVKGTAALAEEQDLVLLVQKLRLREYSGRVFYIETILALAAAKATSVGEFTPGKVSGDNAFLQKIAERVRNRFPEIKAMAKNKIVIADITNEINAAVVIQSAWRMFVAVRKFESLRRSILESS
jgi:hypothetical protein